MIKPLVSIIIPIFNAELHLHSAINSAISQSYTNIEIICINDGSTDNSENIVKEFNDSRIIYWKQNNFGAPTAKNKGLELASGHYIQFLDADDILSDDKIYNQVELLKGKTNWITFCRTKIIYRDNDVYSNDLEEIDTQLVTQTNNNIAFLKILNGYTGKEVMVQPNAYLIPRNVINKAGLWSELLNRSPDDDSEFMTRILIASEGIIYDKNSSNFYRKSINKLSSSKSLIYSLGAIKSIELKYEALIKIDNSYKMRKLIAIQYAAVAYKYGGLHPVVINLIKQHLRNIGFRKFPSVGGSQFKLLNFLFGFENSIKIRAKFKNI